MHTIYHNYTNFDLMFYRAHCKKLMQELHLEERHIEMILNGEKLDDRVIHASHSLMKRMFQKQTGLRDTVVLEGLKDGMINQMDSHSV